MHMYIISCYFFNLKINNQFLYNNKNVSPIVKVMSIRGANPFHCIVFMNLFVLRMLLF